MIARMLVDRDLSWVALVALVSVGQLVGCSKSDPGGGADSGGGGAYAASGGIQPGAAPQAVRSQPDRSADVQPSPPAAQPATREPDPAVASKPTPASGDAGNPAHDRSTPFTIEGAEETTDAKAPLHQLPPDLPPEKLIEFLAGADTDMQVIVTGRSGITDPQQARETLIQIVKMKLEASRRLSKHSEADANARSEGARGELQSLSHLAALGDLKAAQELELLAEANLASSDTRLASDSRLVMIGFAIESLANGDDEAANRIVRYVDQIAESKSEADVPAMMVMGHARESLASYGHDDQAIRVRNTIIELFADSAEPEIAKMAAQLAGNVRFDAIDKLRSNAMDGEAVDASQWREAVERLIDESADLQTVQYLAGAALEFESQSLAELVDVTYAVMSARFNDPASATGREVKLAVDAKRARQQVIGRVFDPDLPQIDGTSLSLADYRGKVVLMPFWAIRFPESLQLVSRLKTIHDAHPNKVAIVGMNLDAEGEQVEQFLQANDLGFRSFRAESSATAKIANPVAAQFGMVSLPFVVILDQTGRVSAINFTGRDLEKTVEELVEP